MKKNSILLLSTLAYSSITFSEPYSVSDILNTKIENKQDSGHSNSDSSNIFCLYSSQYNPCYKSGVSKDSFLNWQKQQRVIASDRKTLYLGTNKLYTVLAQNYELKSTVSCRIYRAKSHSDTEFSNFKRSHPYLLYSSMPLNERLGEENAQVMLMESSLHKDIYSDLLSVFMLNEPEIKNEKKANIILSFQQRHRFIEKSCGEKFMTAYNKYLDDYGKYTAEILQNEQIQKNEEKRLKANERELAIKQKDEEEHSYQQSLLLATQQKEQKYKAEEEAKAMCYRSKKYLMYKASNEIVYAVDSVNAGQKLLQQDDANIKVGSVSNMTQRYRASSMINAGNQALKKSFAEYKQLGGTVSSPYQVKKIANSPCR
ncbi:hypothetical protein B9T24_14105 [Acinetobacter sp. ANC 4654]|uniref:hypothetical protein n=1 Tax=Acinetobacter sp. ANC 4654 TaxID=1977872 RepID=UPI000A35B259|nr:hypothetical protein [Acinetobacter sp. ANC 4654]OTG93599.1 hypothetical protein B9T24_14105 [Acinetobacter sp. ANC 4654]